MGHGWTNAVDITTGDQLRDSTDHVLTARATHGLGLLKDQTVYNLHVAGAHTYYIATGQGDALFTTPHARSTWAR